MLVVTVAIVEIFHIVDSVDVFVLGLIETEVGDEKKSTFEIETDVSCWIKVTIPYYNFFNNDISDSNSIFDNKHPLNRIKFTDYDNNGYIFTIW
jgi:hypothetical protein